jgi:hypothetical protein
MFYINTFFIIMFINSFIVSLDSIIKISKKDTLFKKEYEVTKEDQKDLIAFAVSFLFTILEIIILLTINIKNIFIILFLLFSITLLIRKTKHEKIEKLKIFHINHIIFDIILLIKPLIIYILLKI